MHDYQLPLLPEVRYDLAVYIYDEYKSVHGCRPRWMGLFSGNGVSPEWSDADLINEADRLERAIVAEIERERAEKAAHEAAIARAYNCGIPANTPFAVL